MSAPLNEPDYGQPLTPRSPYCALRAAVARRSASRTTWALIALPLAAAVLVACGNDDANSDGGTCLAALPDDCTPLVDPSSFHQIYNGIIDQSCGGSGMGTTCHGEKGLQGKLRLTSEDAAYAALLGKDGTRARVIPNNPECSILMQRIASTDPSFRMPLNGDALSDSRRCAIQLWIKEGGAP